MCSLRRSGRWGGGELGSSVCPGARECQEASGCPGVWGFSGVTGCTQLAEIPSNLGFRDSLCPGASGCPKWKVHSGHVYGEILCTERAGHAANVS